MTAFRESIYRLLRWSERYTKTDMVYLFESGFWLQSTSLLITFASFLLYIIFGHVLSKDTYGYYQYLLSLGATANAFTMSGMNASVIRAVARGYEGTFLASLRIQFLWGLIPLAGCWTIGGYYLLHGNPTLGWGLILTGIFVPINTTLNTFGAYLNAKKDFKRTFYYYVIVNAPYYVSVALIAVSFKTAFALLAANLISQSLGYYIAFRRTIAVYKPKGEVDPEAVRYGTHLTIINFLGVAISQLDNILVFHYLGAADLALYSFATAVPSRLGFFKNITTAAFPKYAEKASNDARAGILYKLSIGVLAMVIISIVYAIFAYPFFFIFFPRYMDAVPYSQLYAFVVAFAFSGLFVTLLTAQGQVRRLYAYNIISPIIIIAGEFIGVINWGLWGLISALLVTTMVNSLLSGVLALW